jgi:hypothetical protein
MRTETIIRKLYTYDELAPAAQASAREWYREVVARDPCRLEYAEGDISHTLEALGVVLDTHGLVWSGFWSQGDGASFTGTWTYDPDALARVRADQPGDGRLHAAIDDLLAAAHTIASTPAWGGVRPTIWADVTRRAHRLVHEHSVEIGVWAMSTEGTECAIGGAQEGAVVDALRDLMRWAYRQLEAEHEYQNSDEAIGEMIECHAYEFLATGRRA